MAYVTPIHKGGSKQKPEQYRPVSLTSHIMKVFERIIKKKIMEHLVNNKMLNDGQHGFVPGDQHTRSCSLISTINTIH